MLLPLLHRRLMRREWGLLLQAALPSFSLLQDKPQGFLPRGGRPPSRASAALRLPCPTNWARVVWPTCM